MRKLKWYEHVTRSPGHVSISSGHVTRSSGHVSRSSDLKKTFLQGTVANKQNRGRLKKTNGKTTSENGQFVLGMARDRVEWGSTIRRTK